MSNAVVILCVDDEPTGLTARRLLLSAAGYTVLTATSAEMALRLFSCNHVNLVITDHLLPDLTGAELVSEMKRLKPKVPVVLLTGLIDPPRGFEQADLLLTKDAAGVPRRDCRVALESPDKWGRKSLIHGSRAVLERK